MEFVIALVLGLGVAGFVSAPLRRRSDARPSSTEMAQSERDSDDLATLEAAKEAKYREIRDVELDRAAGKVDDDDFAVANAELRAEAIAILDRLDEAKARERP